MGKGLGKADYEAEKSLAGTDGGNMKSFELEKDDGMLTLLYIVCTSKCMHSAVLLMCV